MKADGVLVCYMCDGMAHDVVIERGKWSLLSCAYCNVSEWTDKRVVEKKQADRFVLQRGRHAGKTLDEVLEQKGGRQYLEWLAANEEKLRAIITDHLAAPQAK